MQQTCTHVKQANKKARECLLSAAAGEWERSTEKEKESGHCSRLRCFRILFKTWETERERETKREKERERGREGERERERERERKREKERDLYRTT